MGLLPLPDFCCLCVYNTGLPPHATCIVLQELAQAAKSLVAASDKTNQTQQVLLVSFCWCSSHVKIWSDLLILTLQTLQQYPAALHALTASCTSALEVVQSVSYHFNTQQKKFVMAFCSKPPHLSLAMLDTDAAASGRLKSNVELAQLNL